MSKSQQILHYKYDNLSHRHYSSTGHHHRSIHRNNNKNEIKKNILFKSPIHTHSQFIILMVLLIIIYFVFLYFNKYFIIYICKY